MGLADQIGYQLPSANLAQRLVQRVAATRGGAWALSRVLPVLDSRVQLVTRGRHTLPSLLAGLPVIDLTTTGRRSGQRRTTHLIAAPYGGTLALIGTNFGQRSTPAWVRNLEAEPRAEVGYRGATAEVVARLADDAEAADILAAAERFYVGFGKYPDRITERRLRVFVLRPVTDP